MASEISVSNSVRANKGNMIAAGNHSFNADMAGDDFAAGTQEIGFAAHEAIVIGDNANLGVCWFRNLDATNYIDIGLDNAGAFLPMVRLLKGESWSFRATPGVTLYAKANVAPCDLQKLILEQ